MLDKDLNFTYIQLQYDSNSDLFFCFVEHKGGNNFHKFQSFRRIFSQLSNCSSFQFQATNSQMDQRSIFIFHNYEINEGKIKQRKNYVYRDWKSGKIAIGFSYVSFTRTISLSLTLSLFLSIHLTF